MSEKNNKSGEKEPLISVIMNCYNSREYLKQAIDSVLAQTYKNWEIIFWDNCSDDGSDLIFQSYKDQRFKYYLASKFTTLGAARNLALKKVNGDYIAFLDCDDIWYPKKLEKQLPLFSDSDVGIVICDTIFFNDKKNIKQYYRNSKPPTGKVFESLLGKYFISLETVMIRVDVLKSLDHWFDERFQMIEEYDFFVRVGFTWKIDFVDEVLSKWRVHEKSWTWQKPELFPLETEKFLEKLRVSISDFEKNYHVEIKLVESNIALQKALLLWGENDRNLALKQLKPFIFYRKRIFLIYFWIFMLPFWTFSLINKYRVGLI